MNEYLILGSTKWC